MSPHRVEPTGRAAAALGPVPDLTVRALGPLRICVQGVPIAPAVFVSSKPAELLLMMLCRWEGVTRHEVGLAFWPEASTVRVKNSFHVMLHRLRRALGHPDWVRLDANRYRLDPTLIVHFDARRFEEEGLALLASRARPSDHVLDTLERLLGLYRGEFLEGTSAGDWHLDTRARLRRLRGDLARSRGELLEAQGRFTEAADAWRILLGRDHLDEEACRALIRCEIRRGRRTEALRVYDAFARLLRDELGAEPERETRYLVEAVRRPG